MNVRQTPSRPSPESLTALASDAVGAPVSTVQPLRAGAWSSAYAFRAGGREYVLRFSTLPDDFRRDRYAASFASPSLPIPRVLSLRPYGDLWYAVSERIPGGFLDDLDAGGMLRHLPSLLPALDAMRTADTSRTEGYGTWDATGGAPFGSWSEYLLSVAHDGQDERDAGWAHKLAVSPLGRDVFDECLAQMTELLPRLPSLRQVVHADPLNFNVLVEQDRVSGIIDWGCAMYGDHLYDVAWFAFWEPWYPQWRELRLVDRMLRFFSDRGADLTAMEDRLRCYLLHIGLGAIRYNAWTERSDHLHLEAERTRCIARNLPFALPETP